MKLSGYTMLGVGRTAAVTNDAAASATAATKAAAAATAALAAYNANPTAATLAASNAAAAASTAATAKAALADGVELQAASTDMISRFQLGASGSITTSGGVEMSVYSRLRVDNGERADGFNAPTITIKAGDVTIQAVNTYSAAGARTNVFGAATGSIGYFGIYDASGTWYSSTAAAGMDRVRADLAMGDTIISVSGDVSGAERKEIGISSSFSGLNIGAAYGDDKYYAVDANYSMGGATVGARMTNTINGVYGSYTDGAFSLNAYTTDDNDYGMGASLDLGGGAGFYFEANKGGDAYAYVAFTF